MNLTFSTIYENFPNVFGEDSIDVKNCAWVDPWFLGLLILKALEIKDKDNKKLHLPIDPDVQRYFKRMHLDSVLGKLGYERQLGPLSIIQINERENLNIHEIMHCLFRDDFGARLSSRVRMILKEFGLNEENERTVTALIGELGNNVFDHNEGSWPSDVRGAFVIGQNNPKKGRIELVVADPGVGFLGSLRVAKPDLENDTEAIQLGLSGVTGRVGEPRGNGLKFIQAQTIKKFQGSVRIHSGSGLVVVNKEGVFAGEVPKINGTVASIMIKYT